jgi:1-acyl-sn-glycerol-3-phosphate acyltransferase
VSPEPVPHTPPGLPPAAALPPRAPLAFLPPPLRGAVAALLLLGNTLLWCSVLFVLALLRLSLLPWSAAQARLDPLLNAVAQAWVAGNSAWMRLVQPTRWQVQGLDQAGSGGWTLVTCNHQSWVDILVLQRVLHGRLPLLKFFLKRELIWVPVMGLAWWALGFPFMRRHSDAVLRRHPEKRLEDLEATRRACARFALAPTSVMNFVEGTRFTAAKHAAQQSPYRHLLKPKAGGLAAALAVLGERFDALIDVTIAYPGGAPTFWQFLCGRVPEIRVWIDRHPIPAEFCRADAAADAGIRRRVGRWLNELWQAKDARLEALLGGGAR